MAHVNGNRYRTFGQGARREKEKSSMSTDNNKTDEGTNEVHDDTAGSTVHVTHHEDSGEYHVKHGDGKVTKHGSKQEMLDHLDEHYPADSDNDEDYGDIEEGGEGSLGKSVKSLLG